MPVVRQRCSWGNGSSLLVKNESWNTSWAAPKLMPWLSLFSLSFSGSQVHCSPARMRILWAWSRPRLDCLRGMVISLMGPSPGRAEMATSLASGISRSDEARSRLSRKARSCSSSLVDI